MAHSHHVASMLTAMPSFETAAGSVTTLDADAFPMLDGMSARRLLLTPDAVREPRWTTNANEIAYALRGDALVTIFANENDFHSFTLSAGQMYLVPAGALHHIENIGDDEVEVISALRSGHPAEFGISGSFGAMSDAVLGNTYDLPAGDFLARSHNTTNTVIAMREGRAVITDDQRRPDPFKFDVEAMQAPVATRGGLAKTARQQYWTALDDLSMYSLTVRDDGMREPHWHPLTVEMGYVAKGRGRMTVLDPDGTADTYLLSPGDVYVVPRSYPHHIEDIGDGDIHFLVFFDQPAPLDIGFRAAVSGFSPEVLGAAFGARPDALPDFPFTAEDPLFVDRINPVDPVPA
jgi:oxalate decarboxylase